MLLDRLGNPKFTGAEFNTIVCALECAAETYLKDATTAEQAGTDRIAEQFKRQAEQAHKLAIALRDAGLA